MSSARTIEVPIVQTPTANISEAPVTITVGQLNEMQAQIRAGHERASQLAKELMQTQAADPTGRVQGLTALARALLTVVRFAIANLPPSEIPKWPYGSVEEVSKLMPQLADFSDDDQILVQELALLVADIKEHERLRALKRYELIAGAPSEALKPPRVEIAVDAVDSRCTCGANDHCPLGRTGSAERCTMTELIAAGITCKPFRR